jgi:glucose/arabinose dehydrogenase
MRSLVRVSGRPALTALLLAWPSWAPGCKSGGASGTGQLDASATDGGASDAGSSSIDAAGPIADAGSPTVDATVDAGSPDAASIATDAAPPPGSFCALPGSVVSTAQGPIVIPGADAAAPDLAWLTLPVGFCAHAFATVKSVRQLRFAPGGELFAASPTQATTGYGAGSGIAGVAVLPDDDHDGNADANISFLGHLPAIQALMFSDGYFYYQDSTTIRRVPYRTGDRQPSGASEVVTSMTSWPQALEHWPRAIDQALDGTIYVSNGSTQNEACLSTRPVFGGIFQLNADGSTSNVARGFRNPIALRCESGHDVCLAIELALDYSATAGGREKLVPVRPGDDWGFPCCATTDTPYAGVTYQDTGGAPDCSGVATESDGFVIGHTPFGVDFETGRWPSPWTGRAFVTLHGDVGTWSGARVVAVALDAAGMPLPASEIEGGPGDPANMLEFATGWDDGRQDHGRPAPVAFAPDGRMFLGNDNDGAVVWIAPVDLMP